MNLQNICVCELPLIIRIYFLMISQLSFEASRSYRFGSRQKSSTVLPSSWYPFPRNGAKAFSDFPPLCTVDNFSCFQLNCLHHAALIGSNSSFRSRVIFPKILTLPFRGWARYVYIYSKYTFFHCCAPLLLLRSLASGGRPSGWGAWHLCLAYSTTICKKHFKMSAAQLRNECRAKWQEQTLNFLHQLS